MSLPPDDIAKPLYDSIGPKAFNVVVHWLQDVAADCALETYPEGKVISPSVSWLADAVTFYDPDSDP